jgi:dTDP-4-dehydrorhamnose 3,5-epimerase
MKFTQVELPEVILVEPEVHGDERGFFIETWKCQKFADGGVDYDFVQDNHSRSVQGTLRSLHYQLPPHAQGKLVRATVGEVFDVAADIRRSSPTFGQWVGEYISAENKRMLWVPSGFAHGFLVTSELAEVQYKCTDYCAPECERGIRWDDPEIQVQWPFFGKKLFIVSEEDQAGGALLTCS